MWLKYMIDFFLLIIIITLTLNCYKSHPPYYDGGNEEVDEVTYDRETDELDTSYDEELIDRINNPPVAVLEVYPLRTLLGDPIEAYGGNSYDPDGDIIVEYIYSWGDGSLDQGNITRATHHYNSTGNFNITLTVIDEHGAQGTTTQSVTIVECYTDDDCLQDERCSNGDCVPIPPQRCRREADCTPYGRTCRYYPRGDTGSEELPLACQRAVENGLNLGEKCDQYRRENLCFNELCNIGGSCSIACIDDGDCPQGMVCRRQLFSVDESKGQFFRGCVPLYIEPISRKSEVINDQFIDVPGLSGVSNELSVARTTNYSLALTAVAFGVNDPIMDYYEILSPYQVISPQGELLFDYQRLWYQGENPPLVYVPNDYIVSVMIPNSPVHQLISGNYRITFKREYYSGNLRTIVHETYQEGNTLNLHIFLVTPSIRKENAPTDSQLQSYLHSVQEVLSQVGVRIGFVTYHDVVGLTQNRLRYIDTIVGPDSEIAELFSLSAGIIDSGINIFIVDDIIDSIGIAGAVSGPPGYHGTINSGVALGLMWLTPPYDGGLVLVHEICHYLGLYHTTEANGVSFETIPDTPICGPENDTNRDGFLFPEECSNRGANNLMFWAGTGSELTNGQGFVIKRFANME